MPVSLYGEIGMKKLFIFLAMATLGLSGAMAQYFYFRPLRVECSYDQFGLGPEVEYAFPYGNANISLFVSGNISLTEPDYGSLAIGSRIYPFTFEGKGLYVSPMADILVQGIETNNALSLDLGYRAILFDLATVFAEAGGIVYYNNYTRVASLGFNFCMGFGVAL
jgi:hypothetical protein